jgi:hypothetical protein
MYTARRAVHPESEHSEAQTPVDACLPECEETGILGVERNQTSERSSEKVIEADKA